MRDLEDKAMEHEPRYTHKPKYGTIGAYDAVEGEKNVFVDIEHRAASAAREATRGYPREAYINTVSEVLRFAKTETLEALCAKVPANILEELVQEWLMVDCVTYKFSSEGISSSVDLASKAHLITREAAKQLALRRAQQAPEGQKALAQIQAEARRALLKNLFAGILDGPKVGDTWVIAGGCSYTIEKTGETADFQEPTSPGGHMTYDSTWQAQVRHRSESGIEGGTKRYTFEAFETEFGDDFQDLLVAVRRAS